MERPQIPNHTEGNDSTVKPATVQGCVEFDALVERLYSKLKALAVRVRWSGPKATQPTSLLHQAYLKMRSSKDLGSKPDNEVIGNFAHVMRQIMVDAARKAQAAKRRGGVPAIPIVHGDSPGVEPASWRQSITPEDLLTLDAALNELRQDNPRQADVVERRYFLGMTVAETASVLQLAESTVERDWREGRRFLSARMQPGRK